MPATGEPATPPLGAPPCELPPLGAPPVVTPPTPGVPPLGAPPLGTPPVVAAPELPPDACSSSSPATGSPLHERTSASAAPALDAAERCLKRFGERGRVMVAELSARAKLGVKKRCRNHRAARIFHS
jgi:hypothetical protein